MLTKIILLTLTLSLVPASIEAKCQSINACLCAAENPSHAALRVLPSSVSVGFVNVSEIIRPGDCDYRIGDSMDLSSDVDDDTAFAAYPELIIGIDCNTNLKKFVVLDDESATCPDDDFSSSRDDALTLNASEACLTEVNDTAPNPPCDDTIDGCCATTAAPPTPLWLLLGLVLLGVSRRSARRLLAGTGASASTPR